MKYVLGSKDSYCIIDNNNTYHGRTSDLSEATKFDSMSKLLRFIGNQAKKWWTGGPEVSSSDRDYFDSDIQVFIVTDDLANKVQLP